MQTELQFLISTLEMFGLPKDYMNGVGHHDDWEKKKDSGKNKKGKKNTTQQKKQAQNSKVDRSKMF